MITDREFRELVNEAPYLLDNTMQPVTQSAAMKAYAQNPISLEEFVAGIKARLPESGWKDYDDALARIRQQEGSSTTAQEMDDPPPSAHTKKPIFSGLKKWSRLAVASVLIIALASFFAFAPAGRTLALEIAGFVERLLGNRLEVSINDRPDEIDTDIQEYTLMYSSFDELPDLEIEMFRIDKDNFVVETIEYSVSITGKYVKVKYLTPMGDVVYITQHWDQIDKMKFQTNSAEYGLLIFGEHTIYVSKDDSDGLFDAFSIFPDFIVQVTTLNESMVTKIFSQ